MTESQKVVFEEMKEFFGESKILLSAQNYPKQFEYYYTLMTFYKKNRENQKLQPLKI
jgi:hypothetical protein